MQREFTAIREELAHKATRSELHQIYDLIDKHIKQQEAHQQEHAAILSQLNRHEKWNEQHDR